MNTRAAIRAELTLLGSTLADMEPLNPYSVPDNYFHLLSGSVYNILTIVNQSDPKLNAPRQLPYSTPAGYFETLPDLVNIRIAGESPSAGVFPTPSQNAAFSLPDNYFENLPGIIMEKVANEKTASRGLPSKRVYLFRTVRLAAAITLIIFTGLALLRLGGPTAEKQEHISLSGVSPAMIDEYIEQNIDDFDTEMLENTLARASSGNVVPSDPGIKEDIEEYLDETGWN